MTKWGRKKLIKCSKLQREQNRLRQFYYFYGNVFAFKSERGLPISSNAPPPANCCLPRRTYQLLHAFFAQPLSHLFKCCKLWRTHIHPDTVASAVALAASRLQWNILKAITIAKVQKLKFAGNHIFNRKVSHNFVRKALSGTARSHSTPTKAPSGHHCCSVRHMWHTLCRKTCGS